MTLMQLTIDGREVPHAIVMLASHGSHQRLTPVQRAVMAMLRDRGAIRTVEAGVIVHEIRGHCGFGNRSSAYGKSARGIGCCAYAGADGLAALKRLMARGMVYRDPAKAGRWLAP